MRIHKLFTIALIFGLLMTANESVRADLTTGLVAYYPFNGNANDASGNGNNGLVNGATLTADRFGNANSAYSFDGNSNYIRISNSVSLTNLPIFTISAWIFAKNITTNRYYEITRKEGQFLFSFQEYGTQLTLGINSNMLLESDTPINPLSIVNEKWHHLVGVDDGSNFYVYVDKVLIGMRNHNGNQARNSIYDLYIGSLGGSYEFFNGIIDDVRIYNRALSLSDIQQLYQESGNQYFRITTIPDINGDGILDQAVLLIKSGNYYLQTIDSATGKKLNQAFLGATADIMLSDLTSIGNQISVLITKPSGVNFLQLRDNITLTLDKLLTLPSN